VIPVAQEPARDEKPFSRAAVKARSKHRQHVVRAATVVPVRPKHKEVSVLPPSRVRGHDLKPIHVKKPPHLTKPPHVKKPLPVNHGQGGTHGNGTGTTGEHGKSGK
jgi:hypothetical protein